MPSRINNTPATPTTPAAAAATYTIRSGDTLSAIARNHGVSLQAMINANSARYPSLTTNPGNIQVGWTLTIPAGGSQPAAQPQTPAPATSTPAPAATAPRSNDDILMVGMGTHAHDEAAALRRRGQNVTLVRDSFADDQVKMKDAQGRERTFDLRNDAGINEFAMALGLPGEQTRKVADAIRSAESDARDEVAQLAAQFAKAEKGGTIPSRLVLSGHNVGSGVWGDDNGRFGWDVMAKLTEAMPRAARQIEDVHLSACYSGGQHAMEQYRAMFPNAKTIWAYTGSAPGSWSGAQTHMARWDTATRGSREDLNRAIADGSRKGENVAVWSARLGYMDGNPPQPLADVRGEFDGMSQTWDAHLSGERPVANTQSGPLRDYYNSLQRLLQHPELPAAERPALEARRDRTIRLIYYSATVAPKFQQCYGDQIREGFRAVGMTPPDFTAMSRQDALAQIAAFENKLATTSPKPELAARLLPLLTEGLRDLNPSRIPDGWV